MLRNDQMSKLDEARAELADKLLILSTAVDIQVTLQLLVDKGIVTREEVQEIRNKVRSQPKYANGYKYIEQTLAEIEKYEKDPQAQLREMFNRKLNDK